MEELTPIPSYELNELLAVLKPYQVNVISELVQKHGEEEAAKLWLSARGPSDTQKFGGPGSQDPTPFWNKFNDELRLFICGDKKYKKEREKLFAEGKPASLVIVSVISGFLGSTLGFAPSLVTPVVAIMLHLIGKIGVNAWCKLG
jgi:hypothetical protein